MGINLRYTTIRQNGKVHKYWRLVPSVRRGSKARQETFILCRSQDRVAKERAMRERFEARMEKGLSAIQAACEKRSYQVGMIERRIRRLLAKNSRATGLKR